MSKAAALVAVVNVAALVLSGAASARSPVGSTKWCKHHPNSAVSTCPQLGGGPTPPSNITVSPNPIVETGSSDVYAVITVSTDPAYAEQTVELVAALNVRCEGGVLWMSNQGSFTGSAASASVDNDGNATFTVFGRLCAAGSVPVIGNVEAGIDPTYSTTFIIDPPVPTI